jgi:(1->4)-alpha-D-glucan 1-alpha-D-glucosylmutase
LKVTAPGVPDLYQGTELWDFALVDPDNRRPVDYGARRARLAELAVLQGEALHAAIAAARARPADGTLKLLVTMRALAHRRRHRDLYERGSYLPLAAEGPRARQIVAFARVARDGRAAITVTGRFFAPLDLAAPPADRGDWEETRLRLPEELAHHPYHEVISDSEVTPSAGRKTGLPLGRVFSMLPVAVLQSGPS